MKLTTTILFLFIFIKSFGTNYHPAPTETAFFNSTPAYDTIYLDATYNWETFRINHWHGTSLAHPIVIMPWGGNVVVGNRLTITNGAYGLIWFDCWYVKFEGINNWSSRYGFIIRGAPDNIASLSAFGFWFEYCKGIAIDSCDIGNVSIGIHNGTDAVCDTMENFPNFINDTFYIHKNKITHCWNQGMYLGSTDPDNYPVPASAHPGFAPRAVSCNDIVASISATFSATAHTITIAGNYTDSFKTTSYFGISGSSSNDGNYWYNTSNSTFSGGVTTIYCLNDFGAIVDETSTIEIKRVSYPSAARDGFHSIMYNIVDSTGRPGIQLSAASKDTSIIAFNTVSNTGLNNDPAQGTGIVIGGYTKAKIYNNTVMSTLTWNIASLGGVYEYIHDNIIDSAGLQRPFTFPPSWPYGYVYDYDTMHTTDNVYTEILFSILLDTRLQKYKDSSSFQVCTNAFGRAKVLGIGIGDEQSSFKHAYGSNIIYGNTGFNGTSTPPPITEYYGAVVPYISTTCVTANIPPSADAGSDQIIALPTTTTTVSGSGSDPDGTITGYAWTQVSGPATVGFGTASAASSTVTGLTVIGGYVLRLTVTDNLGATGSATMNITVYNQPLHVLHKWGIYRR